MANTELILLEEGTVVQSFSGVDFNVLGYIPPFPNGIGNEIDQTSDDGDVFMHRMANLQTMSISSTRDHKAARRLGSAWAFNFSRGSRTIAGSLVFAMINGDSFKQFVEATNKYAALSREDASTFQSDAMPPFNIIFTASNESGTTLVGMLIGVRLTNTGMSFGIHDIYTEQVYSFVAERYEPLNGIDAIKSKAEHTLLAGAKSLDQYERAVKRMYGDLYWRRPSLPTVDRYTRGLTGPDTSNQQSRIRDLPDLNPNNTPSYESPSDKIRRSKLGTIPSSLSGRGTL